MNIEQLRHILRAAAGATGEKVFVVIGSQAILGSHPDAPRSLRKSVEGDTYPKNNPARAIEVGWRNRGTFAISSGIWLLCAWRLTGNRNAAGGVGAALGGIAGQ